MAHEQSMIDFFLHIIPKTLVDAFTGSGDLLQVLLIVNHSGACSEDNSTMRRKSALVVARSL